MNRRHFLFVALAALFLTTLASSSQAVFDSNATIIKPDGYATFKMEQGWWEDIQTWFIFTETNNLRFSQSYKYPGTAYPEGLTLDYRLNCAITEEYDVANGMAIVTNGRYCKQGPIFETSPIDPAVPYSGLWQVYYVKWVDPKAASPITSWDELEALIADGDVVWSNVFNGTEIDEEATWTIVDAPIVAVGRLGGPWWPAPNGAAYRLKQVKAATTYAKTKLIQLPVFMVFAQDCINLKIRIYRVIIPDVWDPDPNQAGNPPFPGTLPDLLGANWAPGLEDATEIECLYEEFWEFFSGDPPSIERPPFQLPVVEYPPCASCWGRSYNPFSWRNLNVEYTAIYQHILLTKVLSGDPLIDEPYIKATIDNEDLIEELIGHQPSLLTETETGYIFNAPMVPPITDKPIIP